MRWNTIPDMVSAAQSSLEQGDFDHVCELMEEFQELRYEHGTDPLINGRRASALFNDMLSEMANSDEFVVS